MSGSSHHLFLLLLHFLLLLSVGEDVIKRLRIPNLIEERNFSHTEPRSSIIQFFCPPPLLHLFIQSTHSYPRFLAYRNLLRHRIHAKPVLIP
jgi:hypothetical protein